MSACRICSHPLSDDSWLRPCVCDVPAHVSCINQLRVPGDPSFYECPTCKSKYRIKTDLMAAVVLIHFYMAVLLCFWGGDYEKKHPQVDERVIWVSVCVGASCLLASVYMLLKKDRIWQYPLVDRNAPPDDDDWPR